MYVVNIKKICGLLFKKASHERVRRTTQRLDQVFSIENDSCLFKLVACYQKAIIAIESDYFI